MRGNCDCEEEGEDDAFHGWKVATEWESCDGAVVTECWRVVDGSRVNVIWYDLVVRFTADRIITDRSPLDVGGRRVVITDSSGGS